MPNEKAVKIPIRKKRLGKISTRERMIRFDDSQLIPSLRMKGAHEDSVFPHGFSYEYYA